MLSMFFFLAGRAALVTDGGRGVGKAIALGFVEQMLMWLSPPTQQQR